jgi:hypothetical protein
MPRISLAIQSYPPYPPHTSTILSMSIK